MSLRTQFNTEAFQTMLRNTLGTECVNCGGLEYIQYHHIVPLVLGGTNNIKNIVPLCGNCHALIHDLNNLRHKELQRQGIDVALAKGVKFGRPSIEFPEKWEKIYNQWKNGEITAKKAMELLNLKRNTFYRLVQKYLEETQ